MTTANWRDYITSTPDVLKGRPRIKGTRITVSLILGYLAAGKDLQGGLKELFNDFPDLDIRAILACVDYARELAEFEVVTG